MHSIFQWYFSTSSGLRSNSCVLFPWRWYTHVHTIWSHHIQELRSLRYFSPSARRDCTPEIKSWMHQVTSEPSATVIDSNNAGDTAEVYSYFHTDPRAMQANLALLEICLVVVLFGWGAFCAYYDPRRSLKSGFQVLSDAMTTSIPLFSAISLLFWDQTTETFDLKSICLDGSAFKGHISDQVFSFAYILKSVCLHIISWHDNHILSYRMSMI